ncbi:hypothetical protein ABW19_dt0200539 [Dactylella cylindrospora]|nr:hypothetical protein ABW19_dt0200539 [Dactylella cylindrospora]
MAESQDANTLAMTGGNVYNENCGQQHAAALAGLALFDEIEFGQNVTVVDYGCSEGGNSMPAMKHLISNLPSTSTALLTFNDLPSNDFTSLISLFPNISAPNVFHSIIPRSFYYPILPPSTVDIGFSMSSVNWLQNFPPAKAPNESVQEYLARRTGRNAPAAHKDLIAFLKLRGEEFKSGGKLILVAPSRDIEDEIVGEKNLKGLPYAVLGSMMKLVAMGKIPAEAVAGFNPPVYERSETEMNAAFEELKDTWQVEKYYKQMIPHPAIDKLREAHASATSEEEKVEASKEYAGTLVDWLLALFKGFVEKAWREAGVKEEEIGEVYAQFVAMAKEGLWRNGGDAMLQHCYMFIRLRRV